MGGFFRKPVWIPPGTAPVFPDPEDFEPLGLVAGGGDLSVERLISAYQSGIFPWYDEAPILWWSPDPRAVVDPASLHVSRSLKRSMAKRTFRVSVNEAPELVMAGCADRVEGTWLSDEMKAAYLSLHERGFLKSYEVWQGTQLVGGLYGVLLGGLFAAESKFHKQRDASKVALVCSVTHLFHAGVEIYDVQFLTDHLASMGVHEIARSAYLRRVKAAVQAIPDFERLGADPSDLMPWVLSCLS